MKEAIIQYNDTPSGDYIISWKEFVRCRDCKHFYTLENGKHSCPYIFVAEEDWYCGDAERKET